MQMTTERKLRAAELRVAAAECERKGFTTIAGVNYEAANWLDPPAREMRQERRPVTDISTARAKRTPLPVNGVRRTG